MDEAPQTRKAYPDDLPHAAAADPPLSLERRVVGRRGDMGGKIALAILALVLIASLVAVFLIFGRLGPHAQPQKAEAVIQPR